MEFKYKIPVPTLDELQRNIQTAEDVMSNVDKLWSQIDARTLNDDEEEQAYNEIDASKDICADLFSMNILANKFKDYLSRGDKQYNVSKIHINAKTDAVLKEYDRRIISIFNSDWSEEKISREVGMLYLFSGFRVSDDSPEEYICFDDDVLI